MEAAPPRPVPQYTPADRELLERAHIRDRFLRDRQAEVVLELEQKLEKSERIDPELVDRRGLVDRVRFAPELLGGKLFDSLQGSHISEVAVGGVTPLL